MQAVSAKIRLAVAAALLTLCSALGGCSTGAILADKLPEAAGGLPAGAPARPIAASQQYPAVHDMPPERSIETMTDSQQLKLERELETARDRLEDRAEALEKGASDDPKPAKTAAKPKSGNKKTGTTSGTAAKP